MGGLYHCINRCFHGGILYEPSGEPVFFEDESLLPKDREGNTIHFQKVGGETEIEGEGQEKTLFENLAKEIGYTARDIRGVHPGKGANGKDLEPYGPLYGFLEMRGALKYKDAIKALNSIANGSGVRVVTKPEKTQAEKDIEELRKEQLNGTGDLEAPLSEMTRDQLLSKAKDKGIEHKTRANKKQLIELLESG